MTIFSVIDKGHDDNENDCELNHSNFDNFDDLRIDDLLNDDSDEYDLRMGSGMIAMTIVSGRW